MGVVPAAVLGGQDERAGRGDGRDVVALAEEGDGGAGGDAEEGGRGVGLPAAGREGHAGGVAEGAGGHADCLAQGVLLRVALGGDGLAGEAPGAQGLLGLLLHRRSAGRQAGRARRVGAATAHRTGRHRSGRGQAHRNVPDVDGQSHDRVRRLERDLRGRGGRTSGARLKVAGEKAELRQPGVGFFAVI